MFAFFAVLANKEASITVQQSFTDYIVLTGLISCNTYYSCVDVTTTHQSFIDHSSFWPVQRSKMYKIRSVKLEGA